MIRARWWLAAVATVVVLVLAASGAAIWLSRPAASGPDVSTIAVLAASSRMEGDTLQIDLGKTWFAVVNIAGTAETAGTTLNVRMGERLGADGLLDPVPYGSVRFHETPVTLGDDATPVPLRELDARGMPEGVSVMPVRYIEIAGWPAGLDPAAVQTTAYISEHYAPVGSIRFEGADQRSADLNRLFELGRHTMVATSFMDLFVDGDRERLAYQADALINQRGWYAITGDTQLARRTLAELFREPTWPSEWMSQTILLAWDMYEADGDTQYLASIYDRLDIFALAEFIDDTGLVNTYDEEKATRFVTATNADYLEDIVDWPPVERDGYEMVTHNTVVNAFAHAAFARLADMAEVLGKEGDAERYRARADGLAAAMLAQLTDPATGLYVDGKGSTHTAAHALFVPLAFGLVPQDRVPATIAALRGRIAAYDGGMPASVYDAQFLLDGLFDAGAGDIALELMLNRTDRGWMHMLDGYDATITHETWDLEYKDNLDWNHAWGTAFFNVMFRKMVGLKILEPGWSRWTLEPAAGLDLPISAVLASPNGPIEVTIDPDLRLVTISGGNSLPDFVAPEDGAWHYNLITAP
ncbi:MGH1-like glycoside hydrolase domain-containing protein [Pelagibacterium sp.]|uniref:alpha-L-rhamnosidase-related protein n=1 Tax=Pelagibacterium sp. TaxID=1967288 RepID=UPI003A94F220